MKAPLNILHVEDNAGDAILVSCMLSSAGLDCEFTRVQTEEDFERELGRPDIDLILCDHSLPGFDGVTALRMARASRPEVPFIFLSGTIGEEVAVESLKEGASDYVIKDRMGRLVTSVTRAVKEAADAAERKQLEAQLLRTQRIETIGALTGGIAHDLNNALTPILAAAPMLRKALTRPEDMRLLEIILKSATRGAEMVSQILNFSRGGVGLRLLQIQPLVAEIGGFASKTFPSSISIKTRIGEDVPNVLGNSTQLHQVLLNLSVNARDAMPKGGQITITAEAFDLKTTRQLVEEMPPGRYAVLAVADTGEGIPENLRRKIFEPFFTTKEHGKGTGLGLSTVLGIVKTHNGFVEVDSEPGKGTAFKVYLPAASEQAKSMEHSQLN